MGSSASLEVEVRPPSPFRLPASGGEDRVMLVSAGVATRLLHVEERPVLVRAWQPAGDRVAIRAEPVDPGAIEAPQTLLSPPAAPAGSAQLEMAVERMRFALGVDDDLGEFHRRFRADPLLGPLLRRSPHFRPRRRPWPWEALAWAVVKQLIESELRGADPAPHRRPLGCKAGQGARGIARCPGRRRDRRAGPRRARVDGTGAATGDRPARRRP